MNNEVNTDLHNNCIHGVVKFNFATLQAGTTADVSVPLIGHVAESHGTAGMELSICADET